MIIRRFYDHYNRNMNHLSQFSDRTGAADRKRCGKTDNLITKSRQRGNWMMRACFDPSPSRRRILALGAGCAATAWLPARGAEPTGAAGLIGRILRSAVAS